MSKVTLNVFFAGTANTIKPATTQVGMFAKFAEGEDVTDAFAGSVQMSLQGRQREFKMSFDGCGVTNGITGLLFATGLWNQCREVKNRVKDIIKENYFVTLNCLGLSRGGVAAMYLIQTLSTIPASKLCMNTLLFDPVPGNLVNTQSFDLLSLSTARQCIDCSSSLNLRRVLALYPHEPLPDFAFHAPVFGKYPQHERCVVEEDATLGCHQGALFRPSGLPKQDLDCRLSFLRIHAFLDECGTSFTAEGHRFIEGVSEREVLRDVNAYLLKTPLPNTRRVGHCWSGSSVIHAHERGRSLNKHHRQLKEKYGQRGDVEEGLNEHVLEISHSKGYWFGSSAV